VANVKVENITRTPVENGSNWGSVAGVTPPSGLATPDLFYDDFETGDFTAPNSGGGVNTVGFSWHAPIGTSVISGAAKSGSYGLNGLYVGGNENAWAEQRYNRTTPQQSCYMGYWMRVPANWTRGYDPTNNNNNKYFGALWGVEHDDYTNSNLTRLTANDWVGSPTSNGNLLLELRGQGNRYSYSNTYNDWITPADQGRWMHIMFYLGVSSAVDTPDAKIRLWRRWEDEEAYTLLNSIDDGYSYNTVDQGQNGWAGGYIGGWANQEYVADTNFSYDEIGIWSTDPTNGDLTP
jgi:hypothetical protein